MQAIEFLSQLKKIDKLIENKLEEKERWMAIALRTTSFSDGDRVQATGSQQKMADATDRFVDIEREIDSIVDRLIDTKKEVISIIEQLPASEYDILHKVYVQYLTLADAADACNKTYPTAKRLHKSAVQKVQCMLNERMEDGK